jgi:hypothetical protein
MRSEGDDHDISFCYKTNPAPIRSSHSFFFKFSLGFSSPCSLILQKPSSSFFLSTSLHLSSMFWITAAKKKKNCRTRALLLQNFPAASSLGLVHKSSTFSYLFTHQDIEGSQKKSLTLPLFVCYGFVVKQSMQLCFTFLLV